MTKKWKYAKIIDNYSLYRSQVYDSKNEFLNKTFVNKTLKSGDAEDCLDNFKQSLKRKSNIGNQYRAGTKTVFLLILIIMNVNHKVPFIRRIAK